jgi:hypothetical protein
MLAEIFESAGPNQHQRIPQDELMCSNCQHRQVDNTVKKCGFADWCSYCDASLWATNPDAANDDDDDDDDDDDYAQSPGIIEVGLTRPWPPGAKVDIMHSDDNDDDDDDDDDDDEDDDDNDAAVTVFIWRAEWQVILT